MEFDGFDWDGGNIDKCQRHGVTLAEIESVFAGPVTIIPDLYSLEIRHRAIGRTVERAACLHRVHDPR